MPRGTRVAGRSTPRGTRPGWAVAVLASVGLVASLCMTLVVPIVSSLPALLDTTPGTASWVLTATLLSGAAATPITGRLGDMVGKRRVLLGSTAALVVGAVLCALTTSLPAVLVGRTLQGIAVSAVPLGISLMREVLPPERLASGIALMSATLGIGAALGLPLSALVFQVAGWAALFWTAAALGLVSGALIRAVIPESPGRDGGRFDLVGAVGLSVALACTLLVISKGREWGWGSAPTLVLAAAALVSVPAWGVYELRTAHPLVDLRLTARRAVLVPNLVSVPVGLAMLMGTIVYPQFLAAPVASGSGLGLTLIDAGLVLAPAGVVMMLVSPLSARLSAAAGPRTSLRLGLVVIALSYGAGTLLLDAWWHVTLVISLIGAGVALAYGAIPALIMSAVPGNRTAAANGLNTLMRTLGTALASAVAGAVLSSSAVRFGDVDVPSPGGVRAALLVAAAGTLLALLATWAIPTPPAPDARRGT